MKKICIVNGCAGYGGPERLIEDWAAQIDPQRFSIDYVYTPYAGHESHAEKMIPHCRKVIPLAALVPLYFPRNIAPVAKTESSLDAEAALRPSFKAQIWKARSPRLGERKSLVQAGHPAGHGNLGPLPSPN